MDKDQVAAAAEAARNGDKQAFTDLYNEYRDKVYFFARKNLSSDEEAEDVVSDTFITAMEKIDTLRSGEAFGGWLYSIAYHKCMNVRRADKRCAHFETEEEQEAVIESSGLNEGIMLPEDYAVNEERKKELKAVIDSLKPEMRSAVIMFYYQQLSLAEIAEALGINENAAKQKLFQARKKIKTSIEKLYNNGGVFVLAPIGSMLDNILGPADTVHTAVPIHSVKAAPFTAKAAVISTAAAIAIGTPVITGIFGKDRHALVGDYKHITTLNTTPQENNPHTAPDIGSHDYSLESAYESAVSSLASEADSTSSRVKTDSSASDTNTSADADSSAAAGTGPGKHTGSASSSSQPETSSAQTQSVPETSTAPRQSEHQPVDMVNLEQLQNNNIAQNIEDFLEYIGSNYRVETESNGFENFAYITSDLLPGFWFVTNYYDYTAGDVQNSRELADPGNPGHKFLLSETTHARGYELTGNAHLNDRTGVGMTYTQLKSVLGDSFNMYCSSSGSDELELGGRHSSFFCYSDRYRDELITRYWYFEFDLTEEQKILIKQRIEEAQSSPEQFENFQGLDISDIDPVCTKIYTYYE
ncbi:MAG: sigma-70 family RNA polymerase sigma factor [Ruminococcus sp.]|nr:sigma-70 family RNA polymerase sigma factor [Ruminococcus sp.]